MAGGGRKAGGGKLRLHKGLLLGEDRTKLLRVARGLLLWARSFNHSSGAALCFGAAREGW